MEQIISLLDEAFMDKDADELGVMMEKSPPSIVLVEHKIGISFDVIKPLFRYALDQFNTLRLGQLPQQLLSSEETCERINSLTRTLLVIRGDFPLAFQWRKRLLCAHFISPYDELLLLSVLFTKHPKSPSSWEHRRYSFRLWLKQCGSSFDDNNTNKNSVTVNVLLHEQMKIELDLCTRMGDIYPKNYYSWLYRLWLLQFLTVEELRGELSFTMQWLLSHVSDHNASNHREQVILVLLSSSSSSTRLVSSVSETASSSSTTIENVNSCTAFEQFADYFAQARSLLQHRPGQETYWYHLRGLASIFIDFYCKQWKNYRSSSIEGKVVLGESTSAGDAGGAGGAGGSNRSSSDRDNMLCLDCSLVCESCLTDLKSLINDTITSTSTNTNTNTSNGDNNDSNVTAREYYFGPWKKSVDRPEQQDGINSNNNDDSNNSNNSKDRVVRCSCLCRWLVGELIYCTEIGCTASDNTVLYGLPQQQQFATRYRGHLFHQMKVALGNCSNSTSNDNDTNGDKIELMQRLEQFSSEHLQQTAKALQLSDTLHRGWKYFSNSE